MSYLKTLAKTLLAALALMSVLAACKVETEVSVVVERDGSGVITFTATADKDIIDEVPKLAEDLNFTDLADAGWIVDGPSQTKDGGLKVVLSHPFNTPEEATKIFGTFNGEDGPFHDVELLRTGSDNDSKYSLSGKLEVTGGLKAFADPALQKLIGGAPFTDTLKYYELDLGDALDVRLVASLPGKIQSSSGQSDADGNQIWNATFDGSAIEIALKTVNTDTGATVASIARVVLIVITGVWILVCIALAVLVIRAKRKRAKNTTPTL